MNEALLLLRIMGKPALASRLRAMLVLLALLGAGCVAIDDGGGDKDIRPCGTSCGGGNPPSFRFDRPFTGTVMLFAATQNPVMDSAPFLSLSLAEADSFRLEKSALDSILETDRLDSILKYTLSDSMRNALPPAWLEFNMVFRSGDSAWLVPGIAYQKGGVDSEQVFQVESPAPIDTFRGKVVLPPDDVHVISNPPVDFLYFAGTPFKSRIGHDSGFTLQSFPPEQAVPPLVFRYRPAVQSSGNRLNQITLLQSKTPLSTDPAQVLSFDILVDSIATTWKLIP